MFQSLNDDGYVVFRVGDAAELETLFHESISNQPELYDTTTSEIRTQLVGGGFGALANASSFHTVETRIIELKAYNEVVQAIHQSGSFPYTYMEQLKDRMCLRRSGVACSEETWHRDMTPVGIGGMCIAGDLVLGGWVNCNQDEMQHFVCIPKTHTLDSSCSANTTGFQPVLNKKRLHSEETDSDIKIRLKAELEDLRSKQFTVSIPPGHALLFNQSLIHKVRGIKLKFDLKRVYVGFRFTESSIPAVPDIEDKFRRGAIMTVKSGQIPKMYPNLYLMCHPTLLIELSRTFPEYMKELKTLKGKAMTKKGIPDGEYFILKQHAPDMVPIVPYRADEITRFKPHNIPSPPAAEPPTEHFKAPQFNFHFNRMSSNVKK
jgi:hypothetical protein